MTIVDENSVPVSDATVTVEFTVAINESKSGVTDGNDEVTIRADGQEQNPCKSTGCVTDVTHASLYYAPEDNVKACDNSW